MNHHITNIDIVLKEVSYMLKAKVLKKEVARTYDILAPHYDFWSRFAESKAHSRALSLVEIKGREKVLEVACGTGKNFSEILKMNEEGLNVGVDISGKMLRMSKKRVKDAARESYEFLMADARSLPFTDEAFDVVINSYMLDLIPVKDFFPILREFNRVMRKGGRMVLVNMTCGNPIFNAFWSLLYRFFPHTIGGCRSVQVKPFVEYVGFKIVNFEKITQKGFPSEIIKALKI